MASPAFRWHRRPPDSLIKRRLFSRKGVFVMRRILFALPWAALVLTVSTLHSADKSVPEGFEPLFNGKDLTGWTVTDGADIKHWGVDNGLLYTDGQPGGGWLMTEKEYADFEVLVE